MFETAQLTINWADGVIIYGPLGVGWLAGAVLIDKLMKLHKAREEAMLEREKARDDLIRATMAEQAKAYHTVAHKLGGVQKYLLFLAATHSDKALSELARNELNRVEAEAG